MKTKIHMILNSSKKRAALLFSVFVLALSLVAGSTSLAASPCSANGHKYGSWKKVSSATISKKAKRKHTCKVCKKSQTVSYGKKLKPVIKTNVSSLRLKRKQSTSRLKVTMAKGDAVKRWKSSNRKIVTVSGKSNGRCKIKAGSRSGSAKITITLKSGKRKTIPVKVQKGSVTTSSIKKVPKKITLKRGQRYTLKPGIYPLTSTSKTTYKSSNRKYVTVSSKGSVKAVRCGKAKITVTSGKKTVTCVVTVKHNYNVPVKKAIKHPAKGHYEKKLVKNKDAVDVPIYKSYNVCNKCKEILKGDPTVHGIECGGGWSYLPVQVGEKHYNDVDDVPNGKGFIPCKCGKDKTYVKKWVVDKKAWTQYKTVGYKCGCGKRK